MFVTLQISIKGFKEDAYNVLIATDVAGRGIDVPDVALVVNYDMPNNIEAYTHRYGSSLLCMTLPLLYKSPLQCVVQFSWCCKLGSMCTTDQLADMWCLCAVLCCTVQDWPYWSCWAQGYSHHLPHRP
jgi:hypothetical protein